MNKNREESEFLQVQKLVTAILNARHRAGRSIRGIAATIKELPQQYWTSAAMIAGCKRPDLGTQRLVIEVLERHDHA